MTLGPGILDKNIIRTILRRKIFKLPIAKFHAEKLEWSHKDLAAVRSAVRLALREQQDKRCIYCRRRLKIERRNAYEDIEHFLDKSKPKYRKWAFCCVNLTLACHACNIQKSTKNLGAALISPLGSVQYACGPNLYSWLHPYFDDYHANIEIGAGWTYKIKAGAPSPLKAKQLIKDLLLDDIKKIEADAEALKAELARLNILAMECVTRKKMKSAQIVLSASKVLLEESTFG